MTDCLVESPATIPIESALDDYARDVLDLLAQRRSIRKLRSGPAPTEAIERMIEAVRLTPSAFNLPPWHVVFVCDARERFWDLITRTFCERLDGDRRERYLQRLDGFRPAHAVALIYEDVSVQPKLRDAWSITDDQAAAFVQQGLGMVQLALWLSLTADGLVTSLQHWDWLVQDRLAEFTGIDPKRFRLSAVLPIGYADEPPRPVQRAALERVVSIDRVSPRFADDDVSLR